MMTSFPYKTKHDKVTIEELLRNDWQAGKKTVHQMRMDKAVTDSAGEPLDWRTPLEIGTDLIFHFKDAASSYKQDETITVPILFEDEHIIAALKPSNMATHPDDADGGGTFMNAIMAHVSKNSGTYAEHVHRLDKGTEGIVLVAKHPIAKALFDRMIEERSITRIYHAEVDGRVKRMRGTLQYPIGRDRHHPTRRRVSPNGQDAITRFKIIERFEESTLIEASLESGRTHQIRVHFSHIGHPVKGDTLYGGSETEDGTYRLVAKTVKFVHPFTGEQTDIEIS
ncbi:RluA family pseudouridine synthase [Sporosarcina sp. F6_3S_P_2]|uniref:Pseudouridine synthase n=2 Tax=Sporosarcina highlanderae TaxID=3035916 RepID=A0ABT8JTU7_9BACL|nr:RluA family pseudouridine synthase [Sporosarcina highlanderae]MDN4608535.1 RluA family pseudouridine synthase [Sporosarcina highlanderae]